jgi:hypothetical protein
MLFLLKGWPLNEAAEFIEDIIDLLRPGRPDRL